jgi:major membrane immunogen (membrane-anchored lipoprotein)
MKIFLSIFTATLLLAACGGEQKEGDTKSEKEYEKSKESLEQTEQKNPAKFITVDGGKKKNLIGQTVVRADINNNAKIVTYKDVDVKITFYSKTGTVLEEDHETIYENIAPGKSVHFKSKFRTPKATDSVSFKVVDAKY